MIDTPTLIDIGLGTLAALGAIGTGSLHISSARWRRLAEKHEHLLGVRGARIERLSIGRDYWRKHADALEAERNALAAEKASLLNRLFAAGRLKPTELSERNTRCRAIQMARQALTKSSEQVAA